jgi:glycine hydroxymethyltransferase
MNETRSGRFLADHSSRLATLRPVEIASEIEELVQAQSTWRSSTINMIASENIVSESCLRLLGTDLAGRVSLGEPGDKTFPGGKADQYIDQIEAILIHLAKRMLGATYVEWRPLTVTQANLIALAATTKPGDTIAVQDVWAGGSESYNADALPDLLGLKVVTLPPTPEFGIDMGIAPQLIRATRPSAIVLGGMKVLFPYPLQALRTVADEVGARMIFDAAHLVPLIATDLFQRPIAEGVDIVTAGTHKMAGGPLGGLLATDDPTLAERIRHVTKVLVEGRDLNKQAASAYAFAELTEFGNAYSEMCVANARGLGSALERAGYRILGAERGYTQTHQLIVDVTAVCPGELAARRAADCGIFYSGARMLGEIPPAEASGIRLSLQELTRRGFEPADMPRIGGLIDQAIRGTDPPDVVRTEVASLMVGHDRVRYTF